MLAGGQVREGAAVWRWTVRHRVDGLHDDFVVRTVSWDGDGTCLALTDNGLWAWNGTEWLQVSTTDSSI